LIPIKDLDGRARTFEQASARGAACR
jgi:hypothetical protein